VSSCRVPNGWADGVLHIPVMCQCAAAE
jgi:hypothetical protein